MCFAVSFGSVLIVAHPTPTTLGDFWEFMDAQLTAAQLFDFLHATDVKAWREKATWLSVVRVTLLSLVLSCLSGACCQVKGT